MANFCPLVVLDNMSVADVRVVEFGTYRIVDKERCVCPVCDGSIAVGCCRGGPWRWLFALVVPSLGVSTRLLYVEPG